MTRSLVARFALAFSWFALAACGANEPKDSPDAIATEQSAETALARYTLVLDGVESPVAYAPSENQGTSMSVQTPMTGPVNAWIESSLAMSYIRKSGAINAADFKRDVRYTRHFSDALLTEVTFPAGDGDSKDAAYLNLTWSPEKIWNTTGSGKQEDNPADTKPKAFLPWNFRFVIDGLLPAGAKVTHVSGITVRPPAGDQMVDAGAPKSTRVAFSDVTIVVAASDAKGLAEWQLETAKNPNDAPKRAGSFVYLGAQQERLATLGLVGLGIRKLTNNPPKPGKGNENKIATVTAELSVETVHVCFGDKCQLGSRSKNGSPRASARAGWSFTC